MKTDFPESIAEAFAVRGQAVLVTGAAGRIGRRIAHVFAANGARVMLSDLASDRLEAAAADLRAAGFDAAALAADLTVTADLDRLVGGTQSAFGRIDALINCGAIPHSSPLAEETPESIDRFLATNVRGVWWLTRAAAAVMRPLGGGSVVNIASINGHRAVDFQSVYAGTKAAVLAFTRAMAVELAPHNVRVNAVSPGVIHADADNIEWLARYVREPWCAAFAARAAAASAADARRCQPLALRGNAWDVAMACLYLCAPAARFVTGADLVVDGGKLQEVPGHEPRCRNAARPEWDALRAELRSLPEEAWQRKPDWL